eukprot:8838184-Pyramimonas_sp.AAC.1
MSFSGQRRRSYRFLESVTRHPGTFRTWAHGSLRLGFHPESSVRRNLTYVTSSSVLTVADTSAAGGDRHVRSTLPDLQLIRETPVSSPDRKHRGTIPTMRPSVDLPSTRLLNATSPQPTTASSLSTNGNISSTLFFVSLARLISLLTFGRSSTVHDSVLLCSRLNSARMSGP